MRHARLIQHLRHLDLLLETALLLFQIAGSERFLP